MVNTVTITGNLTDKPSFGRTDAGTKYCRFSVAVSRKVRKDGSWEDKLDGYFKIVAWRALAESCSKLEKGTRVQVSGSLQQRSWLSDDGTRNQVVEIVAEDVSLPLTRKKAETKDEAA